MSGMPGKILFQQQIFITLQLPNYDTEGNLVFMTATICKIYANYYEDLCKHNVGERSHLLDGPGESLFSP